MYGSEQIIFTVLQSDIRACLKTFVDSDERMMINGVFGCQNLEKPMIGQRFVAWMQSVISY